MFRSEDRVLFTLATFIKQKAGCEKHIAFGENRGDVVKHVLGSRLQPIVGIVDRDKPRQSVPKEFQSISKLDFQSLHGFLVVEHKEFVKRKLILICPVIERWIIDRCRIQSITLPFESPKELKYWLCDRAACKGNESLRTKEILNDLYQKRSPSLLHLQEVACSL